MARLISNSGLAQMCDRLERRRNTAIRKWPFGRLFPTYNIWNKSVCSAERLSVSHNNCMRPYETSLAKLLLVTRTLKYEWVHYVLKSVSFIEKEQLEIFTEGRKGPLKVFESLIRRYIHTANKTVDDVKSDVLYFGLCSVSSCLTGHTI